MARIAGCYTTRDGGITYSYDVNLEEDGVGIVWSAIVKRGDKVEGTPSGQVRNVKGINVADLVRQLIEEAMERKPESSKCRSAASNRHRWAGRGVRDPQ